jgi:hypothetical protein
MVGILLIEALDVGVPKGYVYSAMAFWLGVEPVNICIRAVLAKKP